MVRVTEVKKERNLLDQRNWERKMIYLKQVNTVEIIIRNLVYTGEVIHRIDTHLYKFNSIIEVSASP